MSWRDAWALAVKGVRRRPGRAVLTVLAVALASALLTALLTIAGTAETKVLDELAQGGPLAGIKVAAAEPDPGQIDQDNARPGPARDLDDAARQRIAELPEVARVLPVVTARALVVAPSQTPAGENLDPFVETVVGVDLSSSASLPVTVLAGRLPGPASTTELAVTQGYLERLGLERTEAAEVLGTEVVWGAGRLFPEGERSFVRGRWVRAQVVGVVAQEAATGSFLVPLAQTQAAREWTRSGPDGGAFLELASSPYSGLFVVAQGIDNVSRVRSQITAIGYSTSAPENLIATVRRYLHVVEIVLSAVGGIGLVIAALGITNALLAAVRERRREIGVLKAIGARDRDVLSIFLIEAATLGLVGGVLGTTLGWLVARGVGGVVNGYLAAQGLAGVQLGIPVVVVAGGVFGSALLSLLGGTLPALRAARLPAREAVGGA
ncbi:MAG TPA: ABC transporter permease [Acidimicrobiales bacterium]|nr:ABC transporter permease [Acidimicrobiales bacterium]